MIDSAELGAILQKARQEKKITQKQIAEQLGYSIHHISDIERGIYQISASMLINYCEILETTPNEILGIKIHDVEYLIPELRAALEHMDPEKQKKLLVVASIL